MKQVRKREIQRELTCIRNLPKNNQTQIQRNNWWLREAGVGKMSEDSQKGQTSKFTKS